MNVNKEYILFNLKEALEELSRTIKEIEEDADFDFEGYLVNVMHYYDHLNTAWNARNADLERIESISEEDYYRWRQFPNDVPMD